MRLIHTGDWHLGRSLHGVSLIEDQRWWLDRFVQLVRDQRPDAVIIAGDVYDRAVPPADAVALLDDTLSALVRDVGVPVMLVAGNHDSPERVGFGSRMLEAAGLHVAGALDSSPVSAVVGEGERAARFWLLPYADPIETRGALGDTAAQVHDHEAAVAACLDLMDTQGAAEPFQVLVTHHFVAGGTQSESERGLSVGGTGAVPVDLFSRFDFVALGHLHRRQTMGSGRIHYPGSALAYAFDESGVTKAVSVVTLGDGPPQIDAIPLGARRAVRRVSGTFAGVLEAALGDDARDDYLEVELVEDVMPPDALGRLRELYPNLLSLRRVQDAYVMGEGSEPESRQVERLTDEELYQRFFSYVTGDELDDGQRETLHSLLNERQEGRR